MPANTSIAIADGASTPVTHNFLPTRVEGSLATWQERVSGIPIGYPNLSWSIREPSSQSPTYKLVGKLTQPKVVVTTDTTGKSVTSVDYTNLATVEFVLSQKCGKQERTDIRTLLSNALKNATIVSIIDDLEGVW